MSFDWYVEPSQVFTIGAERYTRAIEAGIMRIATRRAPEIEEWMKANHPWQNRTGAAEEGLEAVVERVARSMVTIIMAHGADVDYGIWLETKFGGRDAIIAPAVDHWGVVVWRDVQGLLR